MTDTIALLILLIGLELVLGVDNVLVISIFTGRLPEDQRKKARMVGLSFAMLARILMLGIVLALTGLTQPVVFKFSVRDLILLAGGLFLLYKAVKEIHHTVELKEEKAALARTLHQGFFSVIVQIVLLDIVFSIDSVITAVGMTDKIWVIVTAVLISLVAVLFYSKPVGEFILRNPALKILALSFLITIGVTIFIEGLHEHVPKAYIYLPMGFALFVELIQMRYERNIQRFRQ
jgi:predicted tellurium resistance membrane protein TerC